MTNQKADKSFDEVGAAPGAAFCLDSDMMFDPCPAKPTLLHAVDVVSSGGHTCFTNATEVYRLLPAETRERLMGLNAEFFQEKATRRSRRQSSQRRRKKPWARIPQHR